MSASPWGVGISHSVDSVFLTCWTGDVIGARLYSSRACMPMCDYDIIRSDACWVKRMGLNVFSSLGGSPWRRVTNPIILHHSTPIHLALSFFFSIGAWRLPCRICSQPVCYDYKTLPEPGEEAPQGSLRPCPCPPRWLPGHHTPTGRASWRVLLVVVRHQQIRSRKGGSLP